MQQNERVIKTLEAVEARIVQLEHSRTLWKQAAITLQGILQASGWSPHTEGEKAIKAVTDLLRSERGE